MLETNICFTFSKRGFPWCLLQVPPSTESTMSGLGISALESPLILIDLSALRDWMGKLPDGNAGEFQS